MNFFLASPLPSGSLRMGTRLSGWCLGLILRTNSTNEIVDKLAKNISVIGKPSLTTDEQSVVADHSRHFSRPKVSLKAKLFGILETVDSYIEVETIIDQMKN